MGPRHAAAPLTLARPRLACLVWLLVALAGLGTPARAQLSLRPPATLEAEAGGVAIAVFVASNPGPGAISLAFELELPEGLTALGAPGERRVDAGETALVPVTLAVQPQAPSGELAVTLVVRSGAVEGRATARLRVPERHLLEVEAPPQAPAGRLTVLVRNRSNIRETLTLGAEAGEANRVSPAEVGPFGLEPGDAREVPLELVVAEDGLLTLSLRSADGAEAGRLVRPRPDAGAPPPPFALRGQVEASGPGPIKPHGLLGPRSELPSRARSPMRSVFLYTSSSMR